MTTAAGVGSNIRWKAVGTAVDKLLRLALIAVATRTLGDDAWGRYAFATSTAALLAQLADLGTGLFLTREIARQGSIDPALLGGLLRVRLLLASVAAAAMAAVAIAHWREPGLAWALAAAGVGALAQTAIEAAWAVFRGVERLAWEARTQAGLSALSLVLGAVAVGWVAGSDGATAGPAWIAAAQALANVAAAGWAWRHVLSLVTPLQTDLGALARRLLREVLPLGIAIVASLIYFKIDVPMLRWLRGDAETGSYAAAYRLLEAAAIVPAVAMNALFPALARQIATAPSAAAALHRRALAALTAIGAAGAVTLWWAADPIIALLYGAAFAPAAAVLQALAPSLLLTFVNYLETHMLVALGLVRHQMWVALALCACNVCLNLLWIPAYGAVGAAWATAITEAALLAAVGPPVWRRLRQARAA